MAKLKFCVSKRQTEKCYWVELICYECSLVLKIFIPINIIISSFLASKN